MKKILIFLVLASLLLINFAFPQDEVVKKGVLPLNSTVSGFLKDPVKTDLWEINIPSDGFFSVTLTADSTLNTGIYLMDTNGTTELLRADDSLRYGKLVIGKALKQGKYFLQVVKWWREHYGNYNLVTKFQPADYKNDVEPNDNVDLKQGIDEAKEVELNKEYTGHLGYYGNGSQDRRDWYKFTVPSNGKVNIEFSRTPYLSMYVYVYDIDMSQEIARNESLFAKFNITMNLKPGTYYFYVTSRWDNHYGSYKFNVNFTPNPVTGDKEPNDNVDLANNIDQSVVLPLNAEVTGHLGYYGNKTQDRRDWYKITIPKNGSLELKVTNYDDLITYIYLYESDGKREIRRNENSTNEYSLVVNNLKAGTYYVLLTSVWDNHVGGYKIESKFIPNPLDPDIEPNDKFEPENNIDQSQEVKINTKFTGHLGYYGNGSQDRNDRFKFNLPEDGKLEIVVRNSPTLMTYAYIYDSDGKRELRRDESRRGSYKITIPDLRSGTYYLVLYSAWDIHYGGYEVETVFTPETVKGDKEPNDAFERALDIGLFSVVSGTLGYYGKGIKDRNDFYKFSVPQEADVTINLSTAPALFAYIYVFDENRKEVGRNDNDYMMKSLTLKLKPGTYYIQVYSAYDTMYGGYYLGLNKDVPSLLVEEKEKTEEPTVSISKVLNPLNGHYYAVIDKVIPSWKDAKLYCESLGGHLVTITSPEEQKFIEFLISIQGTFEEYWIGGTDEGSEGRFRWVTGEPFSYTNWNIGEPNNLNGVEHYLLLYKDITRFGKWNDYPEKVDIKIGVICEWE